MFVNSTSYNGSVTLQKAFMAGLTLYPAGAISDNSTLNGETLRPCTANTHKIEVACLRTDGETASSTVTADGEAPVGNVVILTVNAAAGEKLTEQQELIDFQLTNGFIAFYRDDNENIVFVTIDKSGNSYCFVMPDYDVTIYAVMEPIDYSIAFNEPIHGNTTVHKGDALEEISTAHAGDTINVLFSASSSNAYIVTEMTYTYTEDGEEKTGTMELTNPYDENVYFLGTFTMPASDVRISITYQGAYTITYEPSAGISLKQEKFSEVAGETVTLTPYDDYTVSSVSVKCGDEDIPVNTNASGTFSFTMPEGDVVVSAEYVYDFSYVNRYWNESTKSVESEVVDLDPSSLTLKQLTLGGSTIKLYYEGEGLIFFTRDLTFNDRYTISGNMKFIIADGVTVTFSKGIAVNNGATLSIYGQSSDSGKLIANSENYNAAIGSDDQDKDSGANGGGAINIHGGTILATAGSDAAGIGGGNEAGNGNITIYGGTVTAQGGQDAAGIGTGDEPETTAGDIRIYGGTVTAHSVGLGAGIGGGDAGKGGRIYIYGGTVNATGGTRGAGIGGGEGSVANTIQIDGGTVYASGGTYAAGIGTGYDPCNNNGRLESIVINGGNVNATSGYYAAAIGSGTDENITGGEITINGGTVRTCVLYDGGAGIGTGRNSHCGLNITINGGDVAVDHRYTTDEDGEGAAGIGSGYYGDFTGKITITGGVVNAVGSGGYSGSLYFGGAGIGGGCRANVTSGAEIKITGGTVTAVGKNGGAAIGAGAEDHLGIGGECEGSITITGGKVTLSLTSDGGDDAVYCGHGDAGDDNGTLTLAGSLKVYSEGSAPVAFAQRTATSQSHSTGNLVIEACDHPNKTYTITESTHTAQCAYCNTSFDTESHSYASGTNQCSVCGYLSMTFTVSFNAGDGSGTMNSSMVVAGEDYILPACDFTAPEGKAFVGWLVGETQYEVGETITVTMNTTVTAMWEKLCTITFDSDGGSAVESQTVTSGEKATKPEDPTKDGFTFQGWYQVTYADAGTLAEEAFDFENTAISEDITLKAVWQSDLKLAVYSTDTKFGGSVANVTVSPVKTGYKTGESVTVTAEEKQGYTFLGWYAVTGVSESRVTGYGDKLAETLAYTFDITKDTQITAVYEAKGKATVKIIAVNGAKYMVGDDTTIKTGSQENVPIGTTLKLTAADADQVFQWQNESEKILGTGSPLEYYVTSNTTITLVYQYDAENQSYVQFVSDYGQVLSYNQYSASSSIDFPVSPTKYGYTFDKWVFEGTEDEATAETIKAKIGTEKIITLKPKYTKDEAVGSVTVNYKAGNTVIADASTTADIPVGNTKTFTAQDIDGYTFECWKSEDGTVLGYKKDYFMQVTGEHMLNACYVAEGVEVEEAKPTIVIGELEKVTSGSTHKVRGSVTRSIPDGYTLIEHGILYGKDRDGLNEETFLYTDGTDGIKKYHSNDTMLNGVVTLSVKVGADDVVVAFRGYMLLKNTDTGEQIYYYTGIKKGSYQSVH
jgi:uncharacterized repeat protein (TIGR02543 family)